MATPQRKRDIEHFDKWSSTYNRSWAQQLLFDHVHQAIISLAAEKVPHPADILDVGCGTGKLLHLLGQRWPQAHLTGVDPANGMIEVAKRTTPDATFFTGTAEALPLQDASIDLASSTVSFHHWRDQLAGLREIARALRPAGYFLLADITLPTWILRLFRMQRHHNAAEFRHLFEQAGFHVAAQRAILWNHVIITAGEKQKDQKERDV